MVPRKTKKTKAQLDREIAAALAFPHHIAIVTYQGKRFGGTGGFSIWFHTSPVGRASASTTSATRAKAFEIADEWNAQYGKTTPPLDRQGERELSDGLADDRAEARAKARR